MLGLLLLLALFGGLSCSKDSPPTAPAGKSTCALCEFLGDDRYTPGDSDGDTASDSTASSSPDSTSSSSPDTSSSSGSVSSPTDEVVIPDAALRRYIEKVLKKRRGATITQAEMSSLVNLLDGHGLGIKSLVGLEAATNLQNVAMGWNEISDLTPLVHLPKLRYLYIKYNPLSDASIDEIRALERRGVVVSPSYSSPSGEVLIPDGGLRTYIEVALDKEPKQPITQADMNTLTVLWGGSEIKSLIGLETATNLQTLDLSHNAISDVPPLASLVNLQTLDLSHNQVSDVPPLASLVNLQTLDLSHNAISDVPPLASLVNLQTLDLSYNAISDVTPLAHLVNLQTLDLSHNAISDVPPLASLVNLQTLGLSHNQVSDVTPLVHLDRLRQLDVRANFLSEASINEHVPALRRRGVEVGLSPYERMFPESPFDIELVFIGDFTWQEQDILRRAADRWEAAIQADIPDYTFSKPDLEGCSGNFFTIPAGDRIDDLRIYVAKYSNGEEGALQGFMSIKLVRSSALPIMSCVQLNERALSNRPDDLWNVALHEIGHSLGIGTTWSYGTEWHEYNSVGGNGWKDSGMLRDLYGADAHFAGPQAIAAFNRAGGTNYQGAKVPTEQRGVHWHFGVLFGEIMSRGNALSAITLGALSDLGYTVDFSAADPYELPPLGAAKPVADAVPFCSLEGLPPPVYVDD